MDQLSLQPAGGVGLGQQVDHCEAVAKATRWPAWQARMPSPMARWVLPVPGGPGEDHVLAGGDEVQGAQVRHGVAFEAAGVVEVELLQALAGGEPGMADAPLAAVGLAGGDLALQAGGQELLVAPALSAGPLGQPVPDWRRVGAFRARVRNAGSAPRSRAVADAVLAAIRRLPRPGRRRRRSRPMTAAGLGSASVAGRSALPAERAGRVQVRRISDGLLPSPAAGVVSDQPPIAADRDALQVGGQLDAAAHCGRVDRVVVAVQAHVVVARQPQRGPLPGGRRDRRQRQHGGPVGIDSLGWGAAQHPPLTAVDGRGPCGQLGVEIGRTSEAAPGQEGSLQLAVGPLDQALASGSAGRQITTLVARVPRNAWVAAVSSLRPRRHRPIAAWPSQTSTRGTAPSAWIKRPPATQQILHSAGGEQPGRQPPGVPGHQHQHRQPRRLPGLAEPDRQGDGGEPQVTLGDLPGGRAVREAGSAGS